MLSGAGNIDVVGRGGGRRRGPPALVDEHRPDLVLMDIRMPRRGRPRSDHGAPSADPRPTPVVMLTTFREDEQVLRALQAGAAGFLLKHTPPAEIVAAVRAGRTRASRMLLTAIARRLISLVAGDPGTAARQEQARRRLASLSPREQQVAAAIARGQSNADIAAQLHMSLATVKAHVSRLLAKLGAGNRVQIALLIQDASISRPGDPR